MRLLRAAPPAAAARARPRAWPPGASPARPCPGSRSGLRRRHADPHAGTRHRVPTVPPDRPGSTKPEASSSPRIRARQAVPWCPRSSSVARSLTRRSRW